MSTLESLQAFRKAIVYIQEYNAINNSPLDTLKSVVQKLMKNHIKYRILDTTNPKVMDKLLNYEGVLDFLVLLGFESDSMGTKLICNNPPENSLLEKVIDLLSSNINRQPIQNLIQSETDESIPIIPIESMENIVETQEDESSLTLEQIIMWSTHPNFRDNETMETLILMHKTFSDSITVLKALKKRFFIPIPDNIQNDCNKLDEFINNELKRIQLKSVKAVRDWMKYYWKEDWMNNNEMYDELTQWINQIKQNKMALKWSEPLAKAIEKIFVKYKNNEQPDSDSNCNSIGAVIEVVHSNALIYGYLRDISQLFMKFKNSNAYYNAPKEVECVCLYYYEGNLAIFNAKEIAEQITLLDWKVFNCITSRELVAYAYMNENDKTMQYHIKNISKMIETYDKLIRMVQNYVLNVNKSYFEKIAERIIKMIGIGIYLLELRNYHSSWAVFTALQIESIQELKNVWKLIPESELNKFKECQQIFSRDHSFRAYRKSIRNAMSPCIPYLKLTLMDFRFINDSSDRMNGFTCFPKSLRIADRIKNVKMYQLTPYKISEDVILQQLLITMYSY
eukprot:510790_1